VQDGTPAVNPIHYFVCDSSNDCATIDPIGGAYQVNHGKELPFPILTNSVYSISAENAQFYMAAKRCDDVENDYASFDRFARLACSLANQSSNAQDPVASAFTLLQNVSGTTGLNGASAGDQTQWSIVYDLKQMKVTFHTNQATNDKTFAISAFDFSCANPALILDVNDPSNGDVQAKFVSYTDQANRDILQKTSDAFAHLPPQAIDAIVAAVGSPKCTQ